MHISVRSNLGGLLRGLDRKEKQVRFALAVALTRTAQDVKRAEVEEMQRAFDRPTPYTLRSLFMQRATPATLRAQVWLKDDRAGSGTPADRYLLPQIIGGSRAAKSFERTLQRAGYMRPGDRAVPGRFARLDRFGNVSYGQIIQILSQLRLTLTAGYTRNKSTDTKKAKRAVQRQGGQYIALPEGRGKLPPGIYQRRDFALGSAAPRAVFVFVSSVTYRKRFAFERVARRTIAARLPAHFTRAYRTALASAR